MPRFEDSTIALTPVEEVWKLLYDPVPRVVGGDGDR